jgi:hypothetical protein
MKKFLFLFLFSFQISTENSLFFSDFIGNMDWNAANQKCMNLRMRLPSFAEFNIGKSNIWEADGNYQYWTSEKFGENTAWTFHLHTHNSIYGAPAYVFPITATMGVRCVSDRLF